MRAFWDTENTLHYHRAAAEKEADRGKILDGIHEALTAVRLVPPLPASTTEEAKKPLLATARTHGAHVVGRCFSSLSRQCFNKPIMHSARFCPTLRMPYETAVVDGGRAAGEVVVELSPEAVNLLSRILHPDPTRRPTGTCHGLLTYAHGFKHSAQTRTRTICMYMSVMHGWKFASGDCFIPMRALYSGRGPGRCLLSGRDGLAGRDQRGGRRFASLLCQTKPCMRAVFILLRVPLQNRS